MEVGPISTTPAVTTAIILSLLQTGPYLTLVLAAVLAISMKIMAVKRNGAIIFALRVTGEQWQQTPKKSHQTKRQT